MRFLVTRRTAARLIFIIGLFLMFLGSAFLLAPLVESSDFSILIAFFFVIIGALCAVFAIKLNKRSLYLFFAAFFLQVGIFLFLSALGVIPFSFSQVWPVLSIFSGIALLPTCWHRHGVILAKYLVSSVAFVLLGSVLLVFSLDLVSFSLAQFVRNWWPLLVVLAGLMLILISLSTRYTGDPKR